MTALNIRSRVERGTPRLPLIRLAGSDVTSESTGAGEGNRTLVFSLEGCCSTIELHPHGRAPVNRCSADGQRPNTPGRPPQHPRGKPVMAPDFRAEPAPCLPDKPLTSGESVPILVSPPIMKGGDPVSFTKRCHLAGIAR